MSKAPLKQLFTERHTTLAKMTLLCADIFLLLTEKLFKSRTYNWNIIHGMMLIMCLFYSFDRIQCETLATGLAKEFIKREKRIREQDNQKNAKLTKDLKQRKKAAKLLKRKRDIIEKEKGKR